MDRAQASTEEHIVSNRRFQAKLFGGQGDGATVRLSQLEPRISVYRNGGPAFAIAGHPASDEVNGAPLIGIYDLVGPIGPEVPIYVPGS